MIKRMIQKKQIPIVKEGFQFGIPTLIISLISFLFISSYLGLFLFILSLALMAFFRDPLREIKVQENQILSPADGKIVAIEEIFENKYLNKKVKKIDIFLSVFNVHLNYAPCSGKITFVDYTKGTFKNAFSKEASLQNENNVIGIENSKFTILVKQIAGLIARRVICYHQKGDEVTKASKIGLIKFSSRTEIFLPENAIIKVKVGDKVKGALTILAEV